MFVFRGLGFLGFLIPFLMGALAQYIFGNTPTNAGIGYLVGGIIIFFLGRRLNKEGDHHYSSVKSVLNYIDGKHSLLMIRLEYWVFIAFAFGLSILTPYYEFIMDKFLIGFGFFLIVLCILWILREGKSISMQVEKSPLVKKEQKKDKKQMGMTVPKNDNNPQSNFIEQRKQKETVLKEFQQSDHSKYKPQ